MGRETCAGGRTDGRTELLGSGTWGGGGRGPAAHCPSPALLAASTDNSDYEDVLLEEEDIEAPGGEMTDQVGLSG